MKVGEINRRLADARLVYLLAVVLIVIAIWAGVKHFRQQAQLMFVQSAEALKVDPAASTFRLVNVNQQTLFFSDRPQRIAGHYKMADYLKEWSEGKDNFGEDPPNATLSVYEPGQADQSLVVVEINNPVIDGADLIYSYKVLDGTMPASGGETALFIDWIPARPGVGAGGVGGVGVRPGAGAGDPGVGGPRGVGW
jgi:hypothetical protein